MRRSKLPKSVTVLAALLTGFGTALMAATPAVAAGSAPSAAVRTPASGGCTTGALLVPSCGVLWGAAAGGFTPRPRDVENRAWEQITGRTATIFHTYHKGDERFPTAAETAMTSDPAHPRVLLLNWKAAYGSNWAAVAAGRLDPRIDRFAVRAKAYGKKFFLILNHEPENDVKLRPGAGMTAKDFAAMFRHTVRRLRGDGVTNMVTVVGYMGNENWMAKSWWKDLYPGDDVVDWMGLDSYVNAEHGYHYGTFGDLLDRGPIAGTGRTFYAWATTVHPGKPMMLAEWGAYHRQGHAVDKSRVFDSVIPVLAQRPAIKALVYFDTKRDASGNRDISVNSAASSLASFRRLAANPIFNVAIGS